jgi:hypothetical protein
MPLCPEIVIKDPDDIKLVTFDCTEELSAGATVAGITSLAAAPTGPIFASQSIVNAGLGVSALVSGGTHGTMYLVTLRVTTSDGEQTDVSGKLSVRHSTSR